MTSLTSDPATGDHDPHDADPPVDGSHRTTERTDDTSASMLVAAAVASIGAGAIHAVAAGAHNETKAAMWAFALLAAAQLGWGGLALARPSRVVAALGSLLGVGAIGGWLIAGTTGIPGITGLDAAAGFGRADMVAAGLAAVSMVACIVAMYGLPSPRFVVPVVATLALIIAVPGMAMAATHSHDHGGAEEAAGGHVHGAGEVAAGDASGDAAAAGGHDHTASAVPPTAYDPALPIDLGGVEGVTLQQQAAAENLIAVTLLRLPQYADPAVAEAAGFHSIGDGGTGHEHFINRSYINDEYILDPDHPESLVYEMRDGKKTLVAAMFMLPDSDTLDDVPELGGRLTQWHIHDNLCYTPDPVAPRVAGLREPGGPCRPPLVPGGENAMIHVWIVPHECGPFAALDGVGGGTIAQGEERWCDHTHGA